MNRLICIGLGILSFSCTRDREVPVTSFYCFPTLGDSTVEILLDGSKTNSNSCFHIGLKFRWDFEGDGIWDTRYESADRILHLYLNPGEYNPRMEVMDPFGITAIDSTELIIYGANKDQDILIDPRDSQFYRIVKIFDHWWMAENLRFGQEISVDTEQTDNDVPEFYRNHGNNLRDSVGGLYRWFEAMNYRVTNPQGICPPGWHIPGHGEWSDLFKNFPVMHSINYYGKNGFSRLFLDVNNQLMRLNGNLNWQGQKIKIYQGFHSSTNEFDGTRYGTGHLTFDPGGSIAFGLFTADPENNSSHVLYTSVRCIKD